MPPVGLAWPVSLSMERFECAAFNKIYKIRSKGIRSQRTAGSQPLKFCGEVEERLVFDDGTANRSAKLVTDEVILFVLRNSRRSYSPPAPECGCTQTANHAT